MPVTQYIGSRYVPIFADPVEWSSAKEYEPLTIVLHEGNSYTSKQAVPKGIDIADDAFWALTGNYNAQVELYRRETAAAKSTADSALESADLAHTDIDALAQVLPADAFSAANTVSDHLTSLATDITNNTNRSYVGLYGAKENDATVDWDSIFAQIAQVSNTIYFGSGNWCVGNGLNIPTTITKVFGSGCRLYVNGTDELDYMMRVARFETKVTGIDFHSNGRVSKLLHGDFASGNAINVSNCIFREIGSGNFGIYNEGIGLVVSNCRFDNRLHLGGIAIKSHTDNQFDNTKFFGCDVAVAANGANVSNCYVWTQTGVQGIAFAPEAYASDINTTDKLTDLIATNCEFDCVQKLVINPRNVDIQACQFYWNDRDIHTNCVLFWANNGVTLMESINISNNIFKIQVISYEVHTFGCYNFDNDTTQALNVLNYHSAYNVASTGVYNMANLPNFYLTMGWGYQNVHSSATSNMLTHLSKNSLNSSTFNATFSLIGNQFGWVYSRAGLSRDFILLTKNVRNNTDAYMIARYKTGMVGNQIDEYLPISSFTPCVVDIQYSPVFEYAGNINAVENPPDFSEYTDFTANKLAFA